MLENQIQENTVNTVSAPLTKNERRAQKRAEKAELKAKKRAQRAYERDTFHRVRGISPMARIVPYIMETRTSSQNFIFDKINMPKIDEYIKEKQAKGLAGFNIMHVILSSYIRACSQRPAINRFIRGQKVYSRKKVEVAMVVKKEMSLDAPDTVIKVIIDPSATAEEVYERFNAKIEEYRSQPDSGFDKLAKVLNFIPGLFLRWTVKFLRFLDYFGLIPRCLTRLSPFHATVFITSMGSLGIPPVVHHLYDFGTLPTFIAFGSRQREFKINENGEVVKNSYVEVTYNLDERICDGFYYASALKLMRAYFKKPSLLDSPPETVFEDIK